MKKGVLGIFLILIMIGFVSAQSTLSDLLSQLDQSTVTLFAVFILSFSILFFSLNKTVFKDNRSIAGLIAGVIAFFIVYEVNQSGFNISGFFFNFGISSDTFGIIIPVVILAGVIFTIVKLKASSFFVFGGVLILLSFFVYESTILIVSGIILLVAGLFFPKRKEKPLRIQMLEGSKRR